MVPGLFSVLMEKLSEFVANNTLLCVSFAGILGALIWTFVQGGARGLTRLGPTDATRLINDEDAIIVDVRSDGEFGQGHIVNALNVPHNQLEQHLAKLEKYKSRPIITACRSGNQSASTGVALRKHGFERVYHLTGGIAAWQGANLPLTKG